MHKNVLNAISLIGLGKKSTKQQPNSVFTYDDNITEVYTKFHKQNKQREKFHKLFAGIFLYFNFLIFIINWGAKVSKYGICNEWSYKCDS